MIKKLSIIGYMICISLVGNSMSYNQKLIGLYKHVIGTLASDSMQGREVSSIYEKKSATFILSYFQNSKLGKSQSQEFSFLNPETNKTQSSENVYLFIDNHAYSTIVIGAHYDHLGLGNSKSLSFNSKRKVFNGADDNASGVALILGLLTTYSEWMNPKYNYVFVSYSAHEVGLFGSSEFYKLAENKFGKIALVLNFDMVGRLDKKENLVTIYGYSSNEFPSIDFNALNPNFKISINEYDKIFITDAGIFAKSGIPALSFTTGLHIDYHKVSDDEQYINYDGIESIQRMAQHLIYHFKE